MPARFLTSKKRQKDKDMTTAVYKYPVEVVDVFTMRMPKGAELLCVQVQNGRPYLWARVVIDAGHPSTERSFRLAGTGHLIEGRMPSDSDGDYVGTFQLRDGALVFHVFDCGELYSGS
jgi:hypothetical protein